MVEDLLCALWSFHDSPWFSMASQRLNSIFKCVKKNGQNKIINHVQRCPASWRNSQKHSTWYYLVVSINPCWIAAFFARSVVLNGCPMGAADMWIILNNHILVLNSCWFWISKTHSCTNRYNSSTSRLRLIKYQAVTLHIQLGPKHLLLICPINVPRISRIVFTILYMYI